MKRKESKRIHRCQDFLDREKFLKISILRAQPEQIEEGVKAIVEEVKRGSGQAF
ncbi:hypothetical protein [Paenibacillus sp. DMB20]|uniref:hypothetical protein n=1 Tax=Paenibacillus sp. DMB20 TaxID=1642570 RepID=UPI001364B51F|nr:hypothetical protein [Paenibacillus sp. DMB20]